MDQYAFIKNKDIKLCTNSYSLSDVKKVSICFHNLICT